MEGRSGGQTALAHWNGRSWGGGEQVRALNTSPEWYIYVGAVYTPTQISEMLAGERERCQITVGKQLIKIDLGKVRDAFNMGIRCAVAAIRALTDDEGKKS